MKRMLVLGRGWVGSAVETAALDHPSIDAVTAIDPPFDPVLAHRDRIASQRLRAIIADESITTVINACGRVSGTPEQMEDANHSFVEWLCDTITDTGVRLLHVSSASEYGDPGGDQPVTEAASAAPTGPYATSKAAGTESVIDSRTKGLDATAARVFNIVGHPIPAVSPVHQWLNDLTALGPQGGEIVVWWPSTTRDFSMIEDVAEALVDLALVDPAPPVVNVCSGVPLRYGEIVYAIAGSLGLDVDIRSLDRPGIEHVVGDPSLLRQLIGWVPTMSADALARRVTGRDR